MAEKAITSQSSWARLFGELVSSLTLKLGDETLTLDMALSRLLSPDRAMRRSTAESVSETLEPGLRTRAYIYNTLAAAQPPTEGVADIVTFPTASLVVGDNVLAAEVHQIGTNSSD